MNCEKEEMERKDRREIRKERVNKEIVIEGRKGKRGTKKEDIK
jgi:hypothetical protein